MKKIHIFLILVCVFLVFGNIQNASAQISYPTTTPSGEVQGGYFMQYFNNILKTCPSGHVVSGFEYDTNNKKNPRNGTLKCVSVNNLHGQASSLTGSLKGEDGRIPLWTNGGTLFTGSSLYQAIGSRAFDIPDTIVAEDGLSIGVPSGVNTRASGPEFGARLFFEGAKTNSDLFSMYRYNHRNDISELRMTIGDNYGGTIGVRDFLKIGRAPNTGGRNGEAFFPEFSFASNGQLGIRNDNPSAELDVSGNVKIVNGSQGDGKILMSDANGLSSWKKFSEIMAIGNNSVEFKNFLKNLFPSFCIPAGTGLGNTCYGTSALEVNTTGAYNTAVGNEALRTNSVGKENVAYGHAALKFNTTGENNAAVGFNALMRNTTGNHNVANGSRALERNTTGNYNVANGFQALNENTTGSSNVANGARSLIRNTTGSSNVANGAQALYMNTTGSYNVANGMNALHRNTTGSNNIAIGFNALDQNTTASNNVAIGKSALSSSSTYSYNTAVGHESLRQNQASWNTAVGYEALMANTTGYSSVAVGDHALKYNTTGRVNTALGSEALKDNISGSHNVAVGDRALIQSVSGQDNTAIGTSALYENTSGNNNIALGRNAGANLISGSNNIAIGKDTNFPSPTDSHQLNIGNWIYGKNGNIGIGTSSLYPGAKLQVDGSIRAKSGTPESAADSAAVGYAFDADADTGLFRVGRDGSMGHADSLSLWINNREAIHIKSNPIGNVGIGTNNPLDKLHVQGEGARISNPERGAGLLLESHKNYNSTLWFYHNDSVDRNKGWAMGRNAGDGSFFLNYDDNGFREARKALRITPAGNMGVGVENPAAKLDIAGKIKIADGTQGSGKILMSDAHGVARWERAELEAGNNPNDCSATQKPVNGHNYSVIALTNGNSYISTFIENIANGRRQWTQNFTCERGNLGPSGGENSEMFCNNGYISNGTACIRPDAAVATNCSARTVAVNGRNYNVPSIQHNFSAVAYVSATIANGTVNYKQQFECNNGTTRTSGQEELISHTCNAGYSWNGNACVRGGNQAVIDAYAGTTCNTSSIQVVQITPGLDKIPENLNADTLYVLQAGTYEISKKINTNSCSAIIGAGKDRTTIQYLGLAYNSVNLIEVAHPQAVLKKFKILGKKDGAGLVARGINASRNGNKMIVDTVDIEHVGVAGIFLNSGNNTLTNITISNISSSQVYGIHLNNSSNNTFTNITISNISSSSYSSQAHGIYLNDSSNNNTFTNITISNISSSSSHAYGIYLRNGNNNTFTNITISNISSPPSYSSSQAYGIFLIGNNNTFTNITISNISSSSSHAYGIYLQTGNDNTLTNITISNISSSSYSSYVYGIYLQTSNNNTLTNITISNISSSSPHAYGIYLGSNNNTFSNFNITKVKKGVQIQSSSHSNTFYHGVIYKNSEEGIVLDGNNNTFAQMSIYANKNAISGSGNSNFYYNDLRIFGNDNNDISPLRQGLASHWLGGFRDGRIITTDRYSDAWAVYPTNVPGYNHNTQGPQTGLTWTLPISWRFGASIVRQTAPIMSSGCNLSTTSTTKCRPTFGGTDTYNATKKIGEW